MILLGSIILLIGIIGLLTYIIKSKDLHSPFLMIITVFILFGCAMVMRYLTEAEVSVKCLNGKNPYKMEIRYELKDSLYIPKDTIYIKFN